MALTFEDKTFEEDVLASDEVTLVDFWAEWCGPCLALGPTIEELAKEYDGKAKIGKLNVDNNPETAMKYGVRSIPTLLLIKGGEVVEKFVGVQSKAALATAIDKNL